MTTQVTIQTDDRETPAQHIAAQIRAVFEAGRSVLWLVSGGSAISIAVRARELLEQLDDASKLHVALIDERFGEPGHADSNAEQLFQAGFDTSGLTFHHVLTGVTIQVTTRSYAAKLESLVSGIDHTYGLFGMGADGHTAGLLPGNPLMQSAAAVGYFDGPDYQRITMTPRAITHVDEAVLYAVGREKWPVVEQLDTTDLPVASLRSIPSLTVLSDYQKENS